MFIWSQRRVFGRATSPRSGMLFHSFDLPFLTRYLIPFFCSWRCHRKIIKNSRVKLQLLVSIEPTIFSISTIYKSVGNVPEFDGKIDGHLCCWSKCSHFIIIFAIDFEFNDGTRSDWAQYRRQVWSLNSPNFCTTYFLRIIIR